MISRALGGIGLVCAVCMASSAMAQDANAPDCAVGTVLPDAYVCNPLTTPASSCPTACQVPAAYSSAMSCCGPAFHVGCDGIGVGYTRCDQMCGNSPAYCFPTAALLSLSSGSPAGAISALADCPVAPDGATSKCIPEGLIESMGKVLFKTCTSIAGAEGRCVPSCLNATAGLATYLPTDVCNAGSEVCGPCYDPRTGAATGACSVGCDPGPTKPPVIFQGCCPVADAGGADSGKDGGSANTGMCVPTSLVPSAALTLFAPLSCTQPNTVCVPQDLNAIGSFTCLQKATVDSGIVADSGVRSDASAGGGTTGSGGTAGTGGTKLTVDSGLDGGGAPRSKDEGSCSCRLGAEPSNGRGALALALVGLTAVFARRRGRRTKR